MSDVGRSSYLENSMNTGVSADSIDVSGTCVEKHVSATASEGQRASGHLPSSSFKMSSPKTKR